MKIIEVTKVGASWEKITYRTWLSSILGIFTGNSDRYIMFQAAGYRREYDHTWEYYKYPSGQPFHVCSVLVTRVSRRMKRYAEEWKSKDRELLWKKEESRNSQIGSQRTRDKDLR
jgi:hypothetical protein